MGMYTELVMAVELKKDTPNAVIEVLKYMVGDIEDEPSMPKHELFEADRWRFMLRCDSYYFDGVTNSILKSDWVSNSYYLTVRSNLKNYNSEIEKFIDWITPYVNLSYSDSNRMFVGYSRYEESDEPTLIYL